MDNMGKIISFSESAVCKGLALGGKDSTSSHFLREKSGGTFLREKASSWRKSRSYRNAELEKGVLSLEQSVGVQVLIGADERPLSALTVGRKRLEDKEEEMGCVTHTLRKNRTVTFAEKTFSWAIPNLYVRCSQWSICISRGEKEEFIEKARKRLPLFMYKEDTQTHSYTVCC